MNQIIELHDSVIENVIHEAGDLVLYFSHAVIHESIGTPGVDPGVCLSQQATLRIKNGISSPDSLRCPVNITDGELQLGYQVLSNVIPIHLDHDGPVRLSLMVYDDDSVFTQLRISGTGALLTTDGLATYLDDFSGSVNVQSGERPE